MCGIAGQIGGDRIRSSEVVAKLIQEMSHRGPDGSGLLVVPSEKGKGEVVFGHRRLSIIDTTELSAQPYSIALGHHQVSITFNGEIYNFREIKAELIQKGHQFSSSGDTEVLLRSYIEWGIDCLSKLAGMFAFAIADTRTSQVFIARDRLGIKPIYLVEKSSQTPFTFSSEIRSLIRANVVVGKVSQSGLNEFLAYGFFQEHRPIVHGVTMLEAGTYLVTDFSGRILTSARYWNPFTAQQHHKTLTRAETVDSFRQKLSQSVTEHLIADVPLGVFLSGGIDSSAVALLATKSSSNVRTINVGFDVPEFDESAAAIATSRALGTSHQHVRMTEADVMAAFSDTMKYCDQPTIDGTNTLLACKAAKQSGLKAVLSGLGGDEILGGYSLFGDMRLASQYMWGWQLASTMKSVLRPVFSQIRDRRFGKMYDLISGPCSLTHFYKTRRQLFGERELREIFASPNHASDSAADGDQSWKFWNESQVLQSYSTSALTTMLELSQYTRGMLLRDSDVFSMSQSIELRVPFLDHRLVEFALTVDESFLIPDRRLKPLLLDGLPDMPKSVSVTQKKGFALPWRHWFSGPLRKSFEERLSDKETWVNLGIKPDAPLSLFKEFVAGSKASTPSHIIALLALSSFVHEQRLRL
jgi:asparagine synthase (glutamine-hydrolysing)